MEELAVFGKVKKIYKMFIVLLKYYICLAYCRFKKIDNKDTWIISERGDDARDNSYHFFRYVRNNHPEVKIKYVISKSSVDYEKVRILGETIEYGSAKHYISLITSGVLISTHIMGYTPDMSLFWRLDKLGLLKLRGRRVFLQHGIIKDFMPFMAASATKIDLFICGAKPEYDYIIKNFGHSSRAVRYTGLPRFDSLKSMPKRQVLLMPTFRKWLNYENDFKSTEYFRRYSSLLGSGSLKKLLEKYNYNLIFYPHYEIQKKIDSFQIQKNSHITIADFNNFDVQTLLVESDILITDYSSVFFDFGYMMKPVLYYQFDIDKFRAGHYEEGYFSYENDGFGPVVHEEAVLIKNLDNLLKNNAEVPSMYAKRIKPFFVLRDQNNSRRVYDEISSMISGSKLTEEAETVAISERKV